LHIPRARSQRGSRVAGRRNDRGFGLFEDLVQRDVERSARLDRAPPQTREVMAGETASFHAFGVQLFSPVEAALLHLGKREVRQQVTWQNL
jgi:hypothetical protein